MDKEIFDKETQEYYSLVGEFCVLFEHTTQSVRACIEELMCNAYGDADRLAVQIITTGRSPTRLHEIFKALYKAFHKNQAEVELVFKILEVYKSLNTSRNSFVHAQWYINWGNEATPENRAVTKVHPKIKRSELQFNAEDHTQKDIKLEIERLELLKKYIGNVMVSLIPAFDVSISRMVSLDSVNEIS